MIWLDRRYTMPGSVIVVGEVLITFGADRRIGIDAPRKMAIQKFLPGFDANEVMKAREKKRC